MDSELRKYYEELLEMFSTKGWKLFMEDMQRDLNKVSLIDSCDDERTLFLNKGAARILRAILMYEELARTGLEQVDEDNS